MRKLICFVLLLSTVGCNFNVVVNPQPVIPTIIPTVYVTPTETSTAVPVNNDAEIAYGKAARTYLSKCLDVATEVSDYLSTYDWSSAQMTILADKLGEADYYCHTLGVSAPIPSGYEELAHQIELVGSDIGVAVDFATIGFAFNDVDSMASAKYNISSGLEHIKTATNALYGLP